jgi:hypothetical protein
MLITKYFHRIPNNPLSRPALREAFHGAPSPLGEVPIAIGREGGNKYSFNYCFVHDCRYSYYLLQR